MNITRRLSQDMWMNILGHISLCDTVITAFMILKQKINKWVYPLLETSEYSHMHRNIKSKNHAENIPFYQTKFLL